MKHLPAIEFCPAMARTSARAQKNPALTAGGRREADMATPTREPELPPRTDIAIPYHNNVIFL